MVLGMMLTSLGAIGLVTGTVMSGIGALTSGFLAVTGALGLSTVSFTAFTASVWASTVALLANPITWIVLAVVAVGVAIYKLVKYWDEVKAFFVNLYNTIVTFYNKYRGIITVMATMLWPIILPIKAIIFGFKMLWEVLKVVGGWLEWLGGKFGEFFGWLGNFWGEYFSTFGSDVMTVFGKLIEGIEWVEDKARKLFSMLGIDLPAMELISKIKAPENMRTQSMDYFDAGPQGQSKPSTDSTASTSKSVDLNLKNDVGGTLKIEVDVKNGKAKQTSNKPNGNLGFQL